MHVVQKRGWCIRKSVVLQLKGRSIGDPIVIMDSTYTQAGTDTARKVVSEHVQNVCNIIYSSCLGSAYLLSECIFTFLVQSLAVLF